MKRFVFAVALGLLFLPALLFAQANKKGAKVSMKELRIQNGENSIYGKMFFPKDEEKHPVIIFSHGYNGSHNDFFDDCRFFAKNGYIAYSYDFCGGSARSSSSGRTTDMTLLTEKSDLLAVIDYFSAMENADSSRIYLLGGSQGGLVTALAAEDVPDKVRAMALYFPAFCIPDDWRKNYPNESLVPGELSFWGMTLGRGFFAGAISMDVNKATGSYGGNVLIIHGDMDDIVPLRYAQEAQKRYANASLKVLKGERHGFSPAAAAQARKMVLEFTEAN
ncbi:MAG: alpha/beta fold hydrolase [Treponema sp.]|nr:alpha/beta fold hydrolase [Treponema sp.]